MGALPQPVLVSLVLSQSAGHSAVTVARLRSTAQTHPLA